MTDFKISDEQKQYQQLARDFAQKEVAPEAGRLDHSGEFPTPLYKKAWELGLMNVLIPEEYGGLGLKVLEACLISEEMGAGCTGFGAALEANNLAAAALIVAGNEEQKKRFLQPLTQELSFAAFCLDERTAGSDLFDLKCTATRVGDEYVIQGQKLCVTNGVTARWHCVIACTNPEAEHEGLTAFIVPAENENIATGRKLSLLGHRASDSRNLTFQGVKVPAEFRIGEEGEGLAICTKAFKLTRPLMGSAAVGLARSAMEHAIRYAKERNTFGTPIANHQAVGFMLADMAKDIEAARLLCWQAAWLADNGLPGTREAAIARTFAVDMAMKVAIDAVQVFGGYGYSCEYPVEKLMRDAKMMQIQHGTSTLQKAAIGRLMAGVH